MQIRRYGFTLTGEDLPHYVYERLDVNQQPIVNPIVAVFAKDDNMPWAQCIATTEPLDDAKNAVFKKSLLIETYSQLERTIRFVDHRPLYHHL